MSLPNILTLMRILLIPVICALLLLQSDSARWLAFFLFALAAITDFFDGYLARKMNLISPLGRMLDPIADKLLVGAIIIAFAYEGSFDMFSIWAALIIMIREIGVSGLREFLGAEQITVHVTNVAKYKTTVQLLALGLIILAPLVPILFYPSQILLWLAAVLTLISGYQYFAGAWPHLKETKK